MEVIDLDSDGGSPSSQSSLTNAQRERIAKQRELALVRQARRRRSIENSPSTFRSLPEVIDLRDSDDGASADEYRYFRTEPNGSSNEGWITPKKLEAADVYSRKENAVVEADEKSTQKNSESVTLSSEQLKALKAVAEKKSVFLTGSAGTGKSFILKYAIQVLQGHYDPLTVHVTASTGLAACALSGTTLHSFAGIGLGTESKEALLGKVTDKKESCKRWKQASALVIDEISMIDAELFDKLDYIGRGVRKVKKPFGGLQLVVTGDFFQLPPVQKSHSLKFFAFKADCWNDCFHLQLELTHVFRQADKQFVSMLNEIRYGRCSPVTERKLKMCTGPLPDNSGIQLTKLYPRKDDVGKENEEKLKDLNKPMVTFYANDSGVKRYLLKNTSAEEEITLSVGSQVMLTKNLDPYSGLVNGARGVVVRFLTPGESKSEVAISGGGGLPVVRFACGVAERVIRPEEWSIIEGGMEVAKRMQIPLILAWALSVHKCQGMTLDRVETDLSKSFDYGMVYVALSRVKSLDGLRLLGFDPKKIKVHPQVVSFYQELTRNSSSCKIN